MRLVLYLPQVRTMPRNRNLRLKLAIGALVALVGLLSFGEFLPHTDDGCGVEVHCVSCRVHVTAVTDLVTLSALPVGADPVVFAEPVDQSVAEDAGVRLLPPGRAPPASNLLQA